MTYCYDDIAKLFDKNVHPEINKHIRIIKLKPKQKATVQGQGSPGLWYVHKGSFRVTVQSPGDKGQTELADLKAGSVFGEISFIDHSQCTATVTARSAAECWLIPKEILPALTVLDPTTALSCISAISKLSAQRIRHVMDALKTNHATATIPMTRRITSSKPRNIKNVTKLINDACFHMMPEFDHYSTDEIHALCECMPCFEYEKGSQIFNEKEGTATPYLVLRGAAQTYFSHQRKMSKLSVVGPGRLFGITSFVDRLPRHCSAFAREHCLLMAFTESGLGRLRKHRSDVFNKIYLDLHKDITANYRGFLMHLLQAESIRKIS
jgi:CRP-like cAMP-binding protein